jgi:hypothetical protein
MDRIRVLQALATGLSGFAGCVATGPKSDNSDVSTVTTYAPSTDVPNCGGLTGGAFWFDVTRVENAGAKPLQYAELPPEERSIVKTALGDGIWASCEDNDSFFSLRDRAMKRRRQTDVETVYLRYEGELYCMICGYRT